MEVLRLENVEAGYGPFRVLHGVSMVINRGEIVSLIGPNGAGKTTTIKTILGLTTLYRGRVLFEGVDITREPTHRRVARGIGYAPEGAQVVPDMTVLENLYLGAYMVKDERLIQESLEMIFAIFPRLKERANQLAGTLSGGETRMLAIGRALMSRPKLLLLDELSQGLAPKLVLELFNTIKKLNDEYGVSILLVEQYVTESLKISHRAYVMELGRIVLEGPSSEVAKSEYLRRAYLAV